MMNVRRKKEDKNWKKGMSERIKTKRKDRYHYQDT